MDHLEITERRVLDRYLLGQLSDEEAERFERHYLACPECLAELETTEHLVGGLRDAAAEDVARVVAGAAAARRARRPWLAGALLGLVLLASVFLFQRPSVSGGGGGAPRAAIVLALSPLRGETVPVHQVRLDLHQAIVLTLELDRVGHDRYRVVLREHGEADDGTELWRGEMAPDYRDTLSVSLDGGRLAAGDYALEVVGLPDEADVARFVFRAIE
jgi:hypothetical protein